MLPFLRKYNTLLVAGTTSVRIPIIKRGVVDFAVGADWSPAAGDVKIDIDNAGPANVTNLPTAVASGNGAFWEFILTAAELSGKQMIVTIVDAATKTIEDQCFLVETFGNASAMYQADFSLPNLPANVTQLLGTAWLTPAVAGTPDVTVLTASKTGYALSSTDKDALIAVLFAALAEGAETFIQQQRIMRSALAGKASGLTSGASSPKYRDLADSKDRISATTDADGNRSAVTTDGS